MLIFIFSFHFLFFQIKPERKKIYGMEEKKKVDWDDWFCGRDGMGERGDKKFKEQ